MFFIQSDDSFFPARWFIFFSLIIFFNQIIRFFKQVIHPPTKGFSNHFQVVNITQQVCPNTMEFRNCFFVQVQSKYVSLLASSSKCEGRALDRPDSNVGQYSLAKQTGSCCRRLPEDEFEYYKFLIFHRRSIACCTSACSQENATAVDIRYPLEAWGQDLCTFRTHSN